MLGTSPGSAFDMEVLVYPQICNYCLQMKTIFHCHFHLITPLIVPDKTEGNKGDRNLCSKEPSMYVSTERNSPLGLQCLLLLWGWEWGKSLASQCDQCGGERRDLHDYRAVCINASRGFLHQEQEEPRWVNSHVYFRHSESKNTFPLSVLQYKAHLLVFQTIWFFKDLVDCSS